MVTRATVMTLPLAAALALAGCSGPANEAAEGSSTAEETQSAAAASTPAGSETGSSESPSKKSDAASTDVEDLPNYLKPYPDSTVLSSSRTKAENGADSGKLEQVSLVMSAEAEPKDILKYYSKSLKKAGFETYGDQIKTKSAQVVNFRHKDNESLLVVTIAKDPSEKANSIVTVGGNIVP
ncbi:hypothetical protein [Brevibacterium sp.]|uniref:hypothetical protein n=1 Tax=Brevibacterium sp. TaxID=1701 RepID=UPI00264A2BE2|nr:hypothetical protein [Brevibacterium sp.]MDN6192802.1 hypothetical protein [Brevibacterium sp.]MDN6604937.1 hypothetical protein [Brevibacterium sp.]